MTRVFLDTALREKLRGANEQLEFCDEQGLVVGYYRPAEPASPIKSPISREEIERARAEPGGYSLAEILKELGAE